MSRLTQATWPVVFERFGPDPYKRTPVCCIC